MSIDLIIKYIRVEAVKSVKIKHYRKQVRQYEKNQNQFDLTQPSLLKSK